MRAELVPWLKRPLRNERAKALCKAAAGCRRDNARAAEGRAGMSTGGCRLTKEGQKPKRAVSFEKIPKGWELKNENDIKGDMQENKEEIYGSSITVSRGWGSLD